MDAPELPELPCKELPSSQEHLQWIMTWRKKHTSALGHYNLGIIVALFFSLVY